MVFRAIPVHRPRGMVEYIVRFRNGGRLGSRSRIHRSSQLVVAAPNVPSSCFLIRDLIPTRGGRGCGSSLFLPPTRIPPLYFRTPCRRTLCLGYSFLHHNHTCVVFGDKRFSSRRGI